MKNRILVLDSLRGLACLSVVLFHFTSKYAEIFESKLTTNFIDFKYGGIGVSFFFIISGFVIFLSIKNVRSAKHFLKKRFLRLYPIFWICMLLTFVVMNLSPLDIFHREYMDLLANVTMVPDVFGYKRIDGAYWSLLPEIMFYICVAGLIVINKVQDVRLLSIVWLLLMFGSLFMDIMPLRILFNLKFGYLFLIGINFYEIKFKKPSFYNHLIITGCILMGLLKTENNIKQILLITIVIVFYLFVYDKLNWLKTKPLIFLGKISYPLYLIHQFIGYLIIYFLINSGIHNPVVLLLAPIIILIIVSFILTDFIEKPLVKALKKIIHA
jgi:peptidoglycan/LPS O-acetylase OafA/YrhL